MIRRVLLSAGFVFLMVGAALALPEYVWQLPPGVTPPPVPADNPMSDAKVALGRRLFYDADLSRDGTTSCATCHEQHRAFTEGNATHGGVGGVPGRRNVMGLANVGYFTPLTWADPTQRHLEAQMMVPLEGDHPVEMGMAGQREELVRRLAGDTCYQRMFADAFPETGGRIDVVSVGKALATFERTMISRAAPYDRFLRGDKKALSPVALRGLRKFGALGCDSCHSGVDFTDLRYHAIETGISNAVDNGLAEITHRSGDEGAFRTPSLRNATLTGPYLHNGSARTLEDAIRRHSTHRPLNAGEVDELAAFLASLTDAGFISNPAFSLPATACGKPNY